MADLILFNGIIRTQDNNRPVAEAVAVKNGKFIAVGGNQEIRDLAGRGTQKIDLQGRLVLPGFTDSHFHFYDWALGRKWIDLSNVGSLHGFLSRLKEAIKDDKMPELYGGWVLGRNWDESSWPDDRMPNRKDLDAVSRSRPLLLWRSDLHLAVANSRALEICGIHDNTPDPPHGVLGRDSRGSLNGVLQDRAIDLVKEKIPFPSDLETSLAMKDAIAVLHGLGITGLHDFRLMDGKGGAPSFRALQILDRKGALKLRVWHCISSEVLDEAVRIGLRTGAGSDYLRVGHVKIFADGSVGARTAWLTEPYLDWGGTGLALREVKEICHLVRKAESSGFSVAVHAIGDRANHEIINMFSGLKEKGHISRDKLAAPHRIEHLQLLKTQDIVVLAKLGIMGSVQPTQLIDDIELTEVCLGDRGKLAYRFKDLIRNGVGLAFGSDCPVADPNPLIGIYAAVTRRRLDGSPEHQWYAEQCLSLQEAIYAYTAAPAQITGEWDRAGSITPGKLADFVVLEKDIFTVPVEMIPELRIILTCVGGKIVYRQTL